MKINIAVIKQDDGTLFLSVSNEKGFIKDLTANADVDGEILWELKDGTFAKDRIKIMPGVTAHIQAGEETPGNPGGWQVHIDTEKL